MLINKLSLNNFRSYSKKTIDFNRQTTVLVGRNAAGKTNILEALYLLATGESFRAEKIEEMVKWQEEVAHVVGIATPEVTYSESQEQNNDQQTITNNQKIQLQVTLTRGEVLGKRAAKRSFKVNGVPRRKQEFTGNLAVVLFRPEDMDLISGRPSLRRGFLDGVLSQVDRDYRRSWVSYEKALRRRNKLLPLIREGEIPRTVLTFWDQLLIKEGEVLTGRRRDLIDVINSQPKIEVNRWLEYDASVISQKRLQQYEREEVAAGYTLVGPHRDDFKIMTSDALAGSGQDRQQATGLNTKELAAYGSRGEQRMAVLWLKICELYFMEFKLKERPVLLLDDIFSELDDIHDQLVMKLLGQQQTIIATTELPKWRTDQKLISQEIINSGG